MKSIRRHLITTGLLAGFAVVSMAQSAAPVDAPRAAHMQKMHAQHAGQHAQHLAELKSKLNLSTSQESAWQIFEQSMQRPDHKGSPDRAAFEKMTTPERIDQMQALKAQRDARMQQHAEATKTFYAQLNPEQKKIFDAQNMAAMGSGMQRMRHEHHGQH